LMEYIEYDQTKVVAWLNPCVHPGSVGRISGNEYVL
jgi:hypothetical protein